MTITAPGEVVTAEIVRTATEWAEIIRAEMARTAESIILTGRYLAAAKADVQHGEWMPMLSSIGIGQQDAHRYMAIGQNLKSPKFGDLPPSPTALYELSRLDPEVIESGIERGDVHPGMTIKDAKGYAAEIADRTAPVNANTDTGEIAPVPEKPTRDRKQEKRERDADNANGLRNDITAFANGYVMLAEAIADNIAGDKMHPVALDHIADALRDQLDRLTTSTNAALAAIEGAKK